MFSISLIALHGVVRRASQALGAVVGAVLPKPNGFLVQLSGALQTFMASWQRLARLSPGLDLTLARETGPDPPWEHPSEQKAPGPDEFSIHQKH